MLSSMRNAGDASRESRQPDSQRGAGAAIGVREELVPLPGTCAKPVLEFRMTAMTAMTANDGVFASPSSGSSFLSASAPMISESNDDDDDDDSPFFASR